MPGLELSDRRWHLKRTYSDVLHCDRQKLHLTSRAMGMGLSATDDAIQVFRRQLNLGLVGFCGWLVMWCGFGHSFLL